MKSIQKQFLLRLINFSTSLSNQEKLKIFQDFSTFSEEIQIKVIKILKNEVLEKYDNFKTLKNKLTQI